MTTYPEKEIKDNLILLNHDIIDDQINVNLNDRELSEYYDCDISLIPQNTFNPVHFSDKEQFNGMSLQLHQSINTILASNDTVHLFVYNLNLSTTNQQLKFHFQVVGTVLSVIYPVSIEKNRGFAFIIMQNRGDAYRAKKILNDSWLDNSKIKIIIMKNRLDFELIKENKQLKIEQVLKSKEFSEDQICEKLNEIQTQLEKMDSYFLILLFDIQTFELINQRLNDCSSPVEQILLNILEYIIISTQELPLIIDIKTNNNKTLLFDDIKNSGLYNRLEKLLEQRLIDDDNEDKSYSILFEQLLRIYLYMINGQIIWSQLFELCINIIVKDTIELDERIQNVEIEQVKQKLMKIEDANKYQNRLKSIILLIDALNSISKYEYNNNNENILKRQEIIPQIHLCEQEQSMSKLNIQLNLTHTFQNLQNTSFNRLNQQLPLNDFKSQFIQERFVLFHLVSFIMSYSIYPQNQSNQLEYMHLSRRQSYIYELSTTQSLFSFIFNNQNIINNINSSIPNIIHSLIQLYNFQLNDNYNHNQILKIFENIRIQSRWFLNSIHSCCNTQIFTQLSQQGYINALTIAVSTAGGCGEENIDEICESLYNFNKFFQILHRSQKTYPNDDQKQLKLLYYQEIKRNLERIEDEGGIEEIYSWFIKKRKKIYKTEFDNLLLNAQDVILFQFKNNHRN